MKMSYYKMIFRRGDGKRFTHYYESASIPALIQFLTDEGGGVGEIILIKKLRRLPKRALLINGYYS